MMRSSDAGRLARLGPGCVALLAGCADMSG